MKLKCYVNNLNLVKFTLNILVILIQHIINYWELHKWMKTIIILNTRICWFQASDRLGELIQMVDRCEPRNSFLYHDLSQAFSQLVGETFFTLTAVDNFKLLSLHF